MPHLILEYTDNIEKEIDFKGLFHELHQALAKYGNINISNCKSRAIKLNDFFVADGIGHSCFIHLKVRIFSGRTNEIKAAIGNRLKKILIRKFTHENSKDKIEITVEIQEIDPGFYYKYP